MGDMRSTEAPFFQQSLTSVCAKFQRSSSRTLGMHTLRRWKKIEKSYSGKTQKLEKTQNTLFLMVTGAPENPVLVNFEKSPRPQFPGDFDEPFTIRFENKSRKLSSNLIFYHFSKPTGHHLPLTLNPSN